MHINVKKHLYMYVHIHTLYMEGLPDLRKCIVSNCCHYYSLRQQELHHRD